ncbi:MAG TPA: hydroxyacylglutathione hydrolase [Gammaproteobacteria bacterium]
MLEVTAVSALRDNYIWLIHGRKDSARRSGAVIIVDPGETAPVETAMAAQNLTPAAIFITHHHPDHTGGAAALAERFSIPVFGPSREAQGVVTTPLRDGDLASLPELGLEFQALDIPGHTLGHIALYGHGAVFCGDTLFSAGCGRLFEGTPEQMLASLERLAALPGDTQIYCGHEYTAANLAFAATVEPDNSATASYREEVAALRDRNMPSLPCRMDRERTVNPFLRTSENAIRLAVEEWSGKHLNDKVRVFSALRRWKDQF